VGKRAVHRCRRRKSERKGLEVGLVEVIFEEKVWKFDRCGGRGFMEIVLWRLKSKNRRNTRRRK
jgi:hypothetical protein